MDREKVIKGLECCTKWMVDNDINACDNCLYHHKYSDFDHNCMGMLNNDILALLKEQEAVTIKKTKEPYGYGVYGGICPKCRNWIQSAYSFCGFCGQAVKWE